jgi:6-phospho-beta-glucosidase
MCIRDSLSWELGVGLRVDEGAVVDVLDLLIDEHADAIVEETELPLGIIRDERTIPSYYLRYYYQHDELVERGRATPSRASAVAALERELLELYADPSVTTKPAALAGRGGAFYSEAAIGLLASLLGTGEPADHVVNVRNRGILPFLPDDAVIEARAHVSRDEIVVHPLPEVPPLAAGLIAHVSRYEELGVEAALHGGVTRIQRALLAHPLVGQYPLARDMAERLLAENREWLDVRD